MVQLIVGKKGKGKRKGSGGGSALPDRAGDGVIPFVYRHRGRTAKGSCEDARTGR